VRIRFSIAGLMAAVLFFAVGFAGLRAASPLWASGIFTITVTVFAGAIVGAAASRGPSRIAWLGFGVFGWTYLCESVSAADRIRNAGRIAATNWEASNEV
jgi:hypothetical protein